MAEIEKLIHTPEGKLKYDRHWCLVVGAQARITDPPAITGIYFEKGSILTIDKASLEENNYFIRYAKERNKNGPDTVVGRLNTADSHDNRYRVADYGETMRMAIPCRYLELLEE